MICPIKEDKTVKRLANIALITAGWLTAIAPGLATNIGLKTLPGHLPQLPPGVAFKGEPPATNQLRLAIGLGMRDEAGLEDFLIQVYDPASPRFHQYLTPA